MANDFISWCMYNQPQSQFQYLNISSEHRRSTYVGIVAGGICRTWRRHHPTRDSDCRAAQARLLNRFRARGFPDGILKAGLETARLAWYSPPHTTCHPSLPDQHQGPLRVASGNLRRAGRRRGCTETKPARIPDLFFRLSSFCTFCAGGVWAQAPLLHPWCSPV